MKALCLCAVLSDQPQNYTNGSLHENRIDNDANSDLPSSPPAAATAGQAVGVLSNFKSSNLTENPVYQVEDSNWEEETKTDKARMPRHYNAG